MASLITKDSKETQTTKPFTVLVEGNIGCGKTSFLNHFINEKVLILTEPVNEWRNVGEENLNLLKMMYDDPPTWCMTFQTFVFKTLLKNHVIPTSKPVKMMERSLYSSRYCFVEIMRQEGFISQPNFTVLDEWFRFMIENLHIEVDLFVYLRTDPHVVFKRVQEREREEEISVSLDYLSKLHNFHEELFIKKNKIPSTKVLVIDANQSLERMQNEYHKFESIFLI